MVEVGGMCTSFGWVSLDEGAAFAMVVFDVAGGDALGEGADVVKAVAHVGADARVEEAWAASGGVLAGSERGCQ
jgi:hypothetical protein